MGDFLALFRDAAAPAVTIVLGIAVALITHIVSVGVLSGVVAEEAKWSVYNTISYIGDGSRLGEINISALDSTDYVNVFCFFEAPEDGAIIVGWKGNMPQNWFPMGEGSFFRADANADEAYIASDSFTYRSGEAQTVHAGGKEYTVTGSTVIVPLNLTNGLSDARLSFVYDQDCFLFIPLEDALALKPTGDICFRLHFSEKLTREARLNQWQAIVPDAVEGERFLPGSPAEEAFLSNAAFFVGIGALCFLSYINIIAMFWHLLSMQKTKFSVYNIIGAGRKTIRFIVITQYTLVFILAFLAALLLMLGIMPLLAKIDVPCVLGAKEIIAVFGFNYFLSLAAGAPKISDILPKRADGKRGRHR